MMTALQDAQRELQSQGFDTISFLSCFDCDENTMDGSLDAEELQALENFRGSGGVLLFQVDSYLTDET